MKKVKSCHSATRILLLSVSLFFSFNTLVLAQDSIPEGPVDAQEDVEGVAEGSQGTDLGGDAEAGREIFNTLCAACHKLDANSIGPPLRGVTDRRSQEWLHSWIKNSPAMIAAGDEQAVEIYNEYNQVAMPPFPQLSDADIDNILAYVGAPKAEPKTDAAGAGAGTTGAGEGGGVSTNIILGILAFVLLMLLVILYLVNKTLRRFATASGVALPEKKERGTPIWKAFVQNQFLVLVSAIILMLVAGYMAFGYFMQVGIDQGYQPIQPIHFSHKIHAGDNQIDCKFCHSSARVSQTSGIPSLNVCMNCHKSIGEVAETTASEEYNKDFYDGEIQKLYAAVGWDPATQSYSGDTQPVEWVRIHNLPDFAYFNHSQHVSVQGISCQTCHGPVEEMEIMYQHAPLTMGWCINCHRETNVRMEGNEYYEKIHKELAKKYGIEEVTIAEIGGNECMKCHY